MQNSVRAALSAELILHSLVLVGQSEKMVERLAIRGSLLRSSRGNSALDTDATSLCSAWSIPFLAALDFRLPWLRQLRAVQFPVVGRPRKFPAVALFGFIIVRDNWPIRIRILPFRHYCHTLGTDGKVGQTKLG